MKWLAVSMAILALALGGCGRVSTGPESCLGVTAQPLTLPSAKSFTYDVQGRPLRLHAFGAAAPGTGAGKPAILLFFGGSWRTGSITALEDQARAFAARGYVAILADYRVQCRDGSNPIDATEDAMAAYAWVREHSAELGIDRQRMILSGASAGGQLALATAMLSPDAAKPAGLVLFNPAVDLVGPAPWYLKMFARRISPASLGYEAMPPAIIFHGTADSVVPIASVRRFCERAAALRRDCELVEYRGAGHGFYRGRAIDRRTGTSPYADTLARAEAFADDLVTH